jgi:hypothetical protein
MGEIGGNQEDGIAEEVGESTIFKKAASMVYRRNFLRLQAIYAERTGTSIDIGAVDRYFDAGQSQH